MDQAKFCIRDYIAALQRTVDTDPDYFQHLLEDFAIDDEWAYPQVLIAPIRASKSSSARP